MAESSTAWAECFRRGRRLSPSLLVLEEVEKIPARVTNDEQPHSVINLAEVRDNAGLMIEAAPVERVDPADVELHVALTGNSVGIADKRDPVRTNPDSAVAGDVESQRVAIEAHRLAHIVNGEVEDLRENFRRWNFPSRPACSVVTTTFPDEALSRHRLQKDFLDDRT